VYTTDEVDNRRQKRRLNSLTKAQPSTATTPPAPLRDQEDNSAITDPQSSSKNVVASLDTMDVDTTVSDLSTKLHIIPPDGDAAPGLQLRLVFDFCSRYGELSGIVSQDAGLLARRMCLAKDFEHFSFDVRSTSQNMLFVVCCPLILCRIAGHGPLVTSLPKEIPTRLNSLQSTLS